MRQHRRLSPGAAMTAALLISVALLSGCAGDYGKYATTLQVHSTAEATRLSAQSQAIADMVATARPATPMEGTLLAVIGMMQVERLQFVPLLITRPTTGMDVLNTATGHLPLAFMGLANWSIAREGFKMAGDSNVFEGDATVSDSFTKKYATEIRTNSDSTSAVSTAGDSSPLSSSAPAAPVADPGSAAPDQTPADSAGGWLP